jgi:2-aminomuconate deaminase
MLANLGGKVESNKLLIDQAQPHLDRLALDFREVAHCAVRNGGVAINVARALPDRSLMIGHAAGDTVPLHCSAVGKVLLAALEHAARGRFLEHLGLGRFTDRTLTDRAALAREVREVAERGFAVDNEEWEEGLRSIAVPIRNGRGVTVAAIAISAPVSRLDDEQLAKVAPALRASAERLGHALFTESRVFPQKARPRGAFPHLKRVDDFVFISGTSARRPDDSFEGVRVNPDGSVVVDIRKQTRAVFENIRDMLADLDLGLDSLIDIQAYLTDMSDYEEFNDAYAEFFGFDGPTRTTVGVNELPHPHQKLMVRAIARTPRNFFNEDRP